MNRIGVDYAWGGPISPGVLHEHGISFVCRYLSPDPSKNLHRPEYELLRAAGIDVHVAWESTAERARESYAAGHEDALRAAEQRADCGMPGNRPIYLAIDFDAVGPELGEYFHGAHDALGAELGAYGGYRALKWLFDHGLINHGWQTYAWSDGQWEPRAMLRQYSNGHQLAGVEVDYDVDVTPQALYVPPDEHNWLREYDRLTRQHRAPWRRRWLRTTMTRRRKLIWHLAQHHDGWNTLNRANRYRELLRRTE